MSVAEAAGVLGVAADAPPDVLRAAYRRAVRQTHPDVNAARDATERTVALSLAYRVLLTAPPPPLPADATGAAGAGAGGAAAPGAGDARSASSAGQTSSSPDARVEPSDLERVHLVDAETIAVHAPGAEALLAVIEAAHRLGEISYLDPSAGLLEVVVEFVDAPTSSVVLSLQGRANATTEVFCSVEPLSGGDAPPVDAVVRLLLRTLHGEDPSG